MTAEEGWEEKQQERHVERLMKQEDKEFRLFTDEKYYIDEQVVELYVKDHSLCNC